MDNLEKIHALIDDLDVLLQAEFPGYTSGSITISPDGYRHFNVEKRGNDPDVSADKQKFRIVFEQFCINGKWGENDADSFNDYLRRNGRLLEDEDGDQE